jgi:hypothetical protein
MPPMRDRWTDERLDDMNARMGDGFMRLDHEIRDVRTEIRELRTEMGANHRIMLQLSVGTIATMAVGFLGVILTQL